jgi:hypothetical protein
MVPNVEGIAVAHDLHSVAVPVQIAVRDKFQVFRLSGSH